MGFTSPFLSPNLFLTSSTFPCIGISLSPSPSLNADNIISIPSAQRTRPCARQAQLQPSACQLEFPGGRAASRAAAPGAHIAAAALAVAGTEQPAVALASTGVERVAKLGRRREAGQNCPCSLTAGVNRACRSTATGQFLGATRLDFNLIPFPPKVLIGSCCSWSIGDKFGQRWPEIRAEAEDNSDEAWIASSWIAELARRRGPRQRRTRELPGEGSCLARAHAGAHDAYPRGASPLREAHGRPAAKMRELTSPLRPLLMLGAKNMQPVEDFRCGA
jgi:hypothetical protein